MWAFVKDRADLVLKVPFVGDNVGLVTYLQMMLFSQKRDHILLVQVHVERNMLQL